MGEALYRGETLHLLLEGLGQRRRIGGRQHQDHRGTPTTLARVQVETEPRLVVAALGEESQLRLGEAEPPIAAAGL